MMVLTGGSHRRLSFPARWLLPLSFFCSHNRRPVLSPQIWLLVGKAEAFILQGVRRNPPLNPSPFLPPFFCKAPGCAKNDARGACYRRASPSFSAPLLFLAKLFGPLTFCATFFECRHPIPSFGFLLMVVKALLFAHRVFFVGNLLFLFTSSAHRLICYASFFPEGLHRSRSRFFFCLLLPRTKVLHRRAQGTTWVLVSRGLFPTPSPFCALVYTNFFLKNRLSLPVRPLPVSPLRQGLLFLFNSLSWPCD